MVCPKMRHNCLKSSGKECFSPSNGHKIGAYPIFMYSHIPVRNGHGWLTIPCVVLTMLKWLPSPFVVDRTQMRTGSCARRTDQWLSVVHWGGAPKSQVHHFHPKHGNFGVSCNSDTNPARFVLKVLAWTWLRPCFGTWTCLHVSRTGKLLTLLDTQGIAEVKVMKTALFL